MDDKDKHIGTSFDDWLDEEGIRAEVEAKARQRVEAYRRAMAQADRVIAEYDETLRKLAKS